MKSIPALKQRDGTDCGATCLAAILYAYGRYISVSRLRQLAGTDQTGTSLKGMIHAAESQGLQARAARGNAENVQYIPAPAILHMVMPTGHNHYLVLVKLRKKSVRVMDPCDGRFHDISLNEFLKNWSGVFLMLTPKPDFLPVQASSQGWRRFIRLAQPFQSSLVQSFLGAVAYTMLGFSTAFYLQKLIDDVIDQNNLQLLQLLGVFMILILGMQFLIGTIRNIIGFNTGQIFDARLLTAYFRHLFYLPQRFFDTMRTGEILSRVNDAVKIRVFINELAMGLMLNLLIVSVSTALLCFYYLKLAILLLALYPVYFVVHYLTTRFNRKWQRIIMEQSADLETTLVENLQAAATIKRLTLESHVVAKTESVFFRLMHSANRSGIFNLYVASSVEFLNRLLTIVVLWTGSYLVMQRDMTTGELLSFYTLIGYFTGPVAFLVSSGKGIQDALIAADRLFEILDLETENNSERPAIQYQSNFLADIKFEDVSFRYGSRSNVLDNLTLHFRVGEITAVVGESGSGKSTILHLIQQMYPPAQGQVKMGDIPIRYFSVESFRKAIGVIPQQLDLFAGSIAGNIAVGDLPDMENILSVCRQVGADEFIEQFPDTYFSLLGERGVNLSGGQKQKLALARALYRQPEILLMDEVTAHLDPISERKVQELLVSMKAAGKMVIIITHRLSTIQFADTIHVLQNGSLLATGNHSDLLATCAHYAHLCSGTTAISEARHSYG